MPTVQLTAADGHCLQGGCYSLPTHSWLLVQHTTPDDRCVQLWQWGCHCQHCLLDRRTEQGYKLSLAWAHCVGSVLGAEVLHLILAALCNSFHQSSWVISQVGVGPYTDECISTQ